FWAASEGLDQLIVRIGRMISYQEYNTKSPLNGLAAKWAAQNAHLLPIDPRPVAPPLHGAPKAPASENGEKPVAVQAVPDVPTPSEDQWSETIVIAPELPAVSNPPPPQPPPLSTVTDPKAEFAAAPREDKFLRWRLALFFVLLAILSGCLLWYGFQRQAQLPLRVRPKKVPAGASQPAAADTRRSAGLDRLREMVMQLPDSSNPEALRAEDNARKSMQARDSASAIAALKQAVSLDSNFSRAWIELGWMYSAAANRTSALEALKKAVDADPTQIVPYKTLAYYYTFLGNRHDAIATWQKLKSLAPDDPDIASNLGGLYMLEKRYPEAASLFEAAAQRNPSDAYAQLRLGMIRLRSHNRDQGMEAMHKALQIDPGAEMLNDVAYEMAEANTNLPEALVYSQRSIREVEERSQKTDFQNVQKADLQLPLALTAYWDTLGWIYFRMGDFGRAESYLTPAWQLRQEGLVGDHLGQVYEEQNKLSQALHLYNLALEANPRMEETSARIRNLANIALPEKRANAREELNSMRTIQLPAITTTNASADFNVLLGAGGKIEKSNFSSGSEALRSAGKALENVQSGAAFPPDSRARLIRRGILSCSSYTGCNFVFYPLTPVPGTN
ncbi:MAG: tetratricopeptide repeat protein, partial [Candidatus Sulfotelmatobacter sp.]